MKYIVTGGAGFIGSHIAKTLASDKEIEVVIIDDLSTGKIFNIDHITDQPNVTFIKGGITDLPFLNEVFSGADGVFHQAAVASVQKSVEDPVWTNEVNATGPLNVLLAARNSGAKKVVLASSAAIYGDNPNLPLSENEAPKPMSPYAVQKLMDEYYAGVFSTLYDLRTVCLRYFNVYGPGQDPSSPYSGVISIFADKIRASLPLTIYGDGLQTRDFIYVGDVVRANIMAMGLISSEVLHRQIKNLTPNGAPDGIYNIATGRETTLLDLASALMEIEGNEVDINFSEPRAGDIRRSLADAGKAKGNTRTGSSSSSSGFGFVAEINVREGLRKLVKSL